MIMQVQWGLNLRPKAEAESAPPAEAAANGVSTRDWELAKFKADMERLPGVRLGLPSQRSQLPEQAHTTVETESVLLPLEVLFCTGSWPETAETIIIAFFEDATLQCWTPADC